MSFIKKILASTKNIHFQSLLGNGVMAVFGLAIISILYRTLSLKDIGIYVLFLTLFGLVDTVRTGFLTFAFIKFYSGTKLEKANEITGSTWTLSLIITACLIVVNVIALLFSSYIKDDGVVSFLKYFPWVFVAGLPFFMASLIVQGDQRFDRLLQLRLVNQVLFAATVVVLAVLHKADINTVLLAYTFSNLLASLVAIFRGWTMFGTIKNTSRTMLAELFHFGKYSFGTNLSATLFRVTDVFFINVLGPGALAVYYLGGRMVQIIEIPLSSFIASGMPTLSHLYNNDDNEGMMLLMKKLIGMVSIGIFVIAILSIVFAEPLMMIIGGQKYAHSEAPNIFRIIMSLAVLFPADRFFAVMLDVIHKPKINFYKILIMLAVNLVADYVGITLFKSVYSVVIANIFPILTAIIISYIPLNKYYPFSFWNMYKVGYTEGILMIKQTYKSLFSSDNTLNKTI